jgi:predicted metal-binding membrane protein
MNLSFPSFLAVWLVMMAAMMAPSVYPTVRLFTVVRGSRLAFGVRPAPVWAFITGYLAAWSVVGLPAYALLSALPMGMFEPRLKGLALLVAGVYQLTPWKATCLSHCRSPLLFLTHAWRDGRLGAIVMGAHHGVYCVGCCWGLMLVLLALGAMRLEWMVAVAAVVFVEKVVPGGPRIGRALGALLLAAGVAVALRLGG